MSDDRATPGDGSPPAEGDPAVRTFQLGGTFGSTTPLPLNLLPPETIERLRAGGELSAEEWEIVQSAGLRGAGTLGALVRAALSSGLLEPDATESGSVRATTIGIDEGVVQPGPARRFEWTWRGTGAPSREDDRPATYLELLTGRRDPHGDVFIAARRVLNAVAWAMAIGVPAGLVLLAILTHQSPETTVAIGVLAGIFGLMVRRSIGRSPFS